MRVGAKATAYDWLIHRADRECYFLWGAIKNALLVELENDEFDLIAALSRIDRQSVREILVLVLTEYAQEHPEETRQLLQRLTKPGGIKRVLFGIVPPLLGKWVDKKARTAKKVVAEAARSLEETTLLEQLAVDTDRSIRVQAMRNAYHVWRANPEKGLEILNSVAERSVGAFGLPRVTAIEACLLISALMLQDYDPVHKQWDEWLLSLKRAWDKVIEQVFLVSSKRGVSSLLKDWTRATALRLVVSFAVGQAEKPTLRPSFINDASLFFQADKKIHDRFKRLLRCLDLRDPLSIESALRDLELAVEENDVMTATLVTLIIILQGVERPQRVAPIAASLFDYALNQSPPGVYPFNILYAVGQLLLLSDSIDNDDLYKLHQEMCMAYLDKTKGIFYSNLGLHRNLGLGEHGIMRSRRMNPQDLDLHSLYIQQALKNKDWSFLEFLLLVDVAALGTAFAEPEGALETLGVLLDSREERVRRYLVEVLARIRLHYPDLVDDFMDENAVDDQTKLQVRTKEAAENPWGDLLQDNAGMILLRVMQAPSVREKATWFLSQAPDCSNLQEFIELGFKVLIDFAYGQPVFVTTNRKRKK